MALNIHVKMWRVRVGDIIFIRLGQITLQFVHLNGTKSNYKTRNDSSADDSFLNQIWKKKLDTSLKYCVIKYLHRR